MFKFIMSFTASIVILVVWSDWVFEKVPGSRKAWEWTQAKIIDVYQNYGWQGVLILGLVCVGVMNIASKK
ncbi:Transmembrane protein [Bacillus pseudomycoides]